MNVFFFFPLTRGCSKGLDAFRFFFKHNESAILDQLSNTSPATQTSVCVYVFFPSILDIKFVGRTSRGHTGGRSQTSKDLPSAVRALIFVARRTQTSKDSNRNK